MKRANENIKKKLNRGKKQRTTPYHSFKKRNTVKPFEFLAAVSESGMAEQQKYTDKSEKNNESFRIALL